MERMIMIYLFAMNLLGLAAMAVDKNRAKRHAWRIPEKSLFLVSLLGGSVGTWAGMYLFRHKTKHRDAAHSGSAGLCGMVSYIVISGRSFKNSSVDCDIGSVGLMEATICREGSFSFVRTTYRSFESRLKQ